MFGPVDRLFLLPRRGAGQLRFFRAWRRQACPLQLGLQVWGWGLYRRSWFQGSYDLDLHGSSLDAFKKMLPRAQPIRTTRPVRQGMFAVACPCAPESNFACRDEEHCTGAV